MTDLVKRAKLTVGGRKHPLVKEGALIWELIDEIERLKRELYKCKIEAKTIVDFNDELQQRIAELEAVVDVSDGQE